MKISLKPQHLKIYKEIAALLLKYGRSDIVQEFGLDETLDDKEVQKVEGGRDPDQLAADLEKMGPTFVKLGQVLSSRPDLLPIRYIRALERLQDKVKPFPYEDVERIVQDELGSRISKAFSFFDKEPLAAASLGQVHKANLRDGRPVVVKVQRPGIRQQIVQELHVLEEISQILEHTTIGRKYQVLKIFEEFRRTLVQELDYQREAGNMTALAENLKEFPRIKVPFPVMDYTTRSVLTMEFMTGRKITSLTPLARMDLDGAALADELFRAYLKQVMVDGLFHADPHPGNVFLTAENNIALLDLGMIGRTTPGMQEQLVKLLVAISEGKGEATAEIAIQLSETTENFNEKEFRKKLNTLVAEHQNNRIKELDVGKALLGLAHAAGENGLYVPTELTMLGKTLLQLDEIGKTLDPDFNPNEAIKRNVSDILNKRVWKQLSPGNIFSSIFEIKEFIGTMPSRLNRILDAVANAELEVKIKAVDASLLLGAFQKIANRITTGLILAALIIGAALLMQVQTPFKIFGYPGLAMLCFLAAGGLGFYLVISIFISDHRDKKRGELK
ncbi:MAG: ABC1 kinase family protein [Verrucomicrobiales bacterium]